MMRIGVLASHRGSNLQAIMDACSSGFLAAEVAVVISNNSGALALERAREAGIDAVHLSSRTHPDPEHLDAAMLAVLREHQVELVVTAGFLRKLGPATLSQYAHRIINTHPSLLPRYGGKGMYGLRVHTTVLANGDPTTGITVHYVDADYDTGDIIAQCEIEVLPGDTPELLEERVLDIERPFLVRTLKGLIEAT